MYYLPSNLLPSHYSWHLRVIPTIDIKDSHEGFFSLFWLTILLSGVMSDRSPHKHSQGTINWRNVNIVDNRQERVYTVIPLSDGATSVIDSSISAAFFGSSATWMYTCKYMYIFVVEVFLTSSETTKEKISWCRAMSANWCRCKHVLKTRRTAFKNLKYEINT